MYFSKFFNGEYEWQQNVKQQQDNVHVIEEEQDIDLGRNIMNISESTNNNINKMN